jgi:N-acetylmuramoyl-L-alanine amidase
MNKKIFAKGMLLKACLSVALATLPVLGFAAPTVTLDSVGITSEDGGTRVVLETSSITKSDYFTLENPDRIVIDLSNTRLGKGVRMPTGIGAVDVVRTGVRPKDTLRVVLELKKDAKSRGEWRPAFADVGDQYVVAIGSSAFVAATFATDVPAAVASSSGTPAKRPAAEIAIAENGAPATKAASGSASAKKSPGSESPSANKSEASEAIPRPVKPSHAPIDGDRDIVVAVDAGHGGQDPGAIGRNGTMEKNVVLAIARALANRIDQEPGMRAYLVRDDDYFVVLRDRMLRARNAKADIFVSVHADSIRDRKITGASVYVISERGATSEAARWLAERENAADLMGGVKLDDKDKSLASVLLDLSQTANISASMTAAERVLESLDRSVNVRKTRVQQAPLVVLKSPDIPSMLVETAYISNPGEEARLKSIRHQKKIAEAIFTVIRGYFETNPPPGTRFAQIRRSQLAGVPGSPATP